MASIKEAFDITLREAFGGLKVCVWAFPLAICYSLLASNSGFGYILTFVVAVIFIGYLTESEHNVIKKDCKILPGINILSYGLIGLLTVLVMIPFTLLGWGVWYLVDAFVKIPSPIWQQTAQIIGIFLAISVVLTAHTLFIRRLNPLELLNVKKYFIGFGEVFLSFSFLVIKLAFWAVLFVGFAVYLFTMFVGLENIIWRFFICAYVVLNLFVGANYMAQLSEEIYVFIEKDETKKREQAAIERLRKQ